MAKVYTKADFDVIYNKYGINNLKYNSYHFMIPGYPEQKEDIIPLWVADMDFLVCDSIQNSQKQLIEQNDYSEKNYYKVQQNAKDSVKNWLKKRHNVKVETEEITFSQNTVNGYLDSLKTVTKEGDGAIFFTPNYYQMHIQGKAVKRKIIGCELIIKDNNYHIDFEKLEKLLQQQENKVVVITNPHNPTGRSWKKEEIKKITELVVKYDKYLISDDVFADISYDTYVNVLADNKEIEQRALVLFGPSKSFNISGNQSSSTIIKNEKLRQKYREIQKSYGFIPQIQTFSSFIGAYTEQGHQWLVELRKYLQNNYFYIKNYLKSEKELEFMEMEGGYLVLMRHPSISNEKMKEIFIKQNIIAQGIKEFYEPPRITDELRINIAVQRSVLEKVVERIKNGLEEFRTQESN